MTRRTQTEGEAWAGRELARLRDARFAPAAVVAFLAASTSRARDVRHARPQLARRARRWELIGAGAYAADALRARRSAARLAGAAAWWAAVCLMLDWHLGMVESVDGRARNLGPADALTLSRAWMVPAIAADLPPWLLLAAGATDVLDGPLARASVPTRAGRDLEGLADAAVSVAALAAAARRGGLAATPVTLELARLVAGLSYATATYFARAAPPPPWVLRAGRATGPIRMAGLLAAAAGHRRAAGALVTGSAVASTAVVLSAAAAGRERPSARAAAAPACAGSAAAPGRARRRRGRSPR